MLLTTKCKKPHTNQKQNYPIVLLQYMAFQEKCLYNAMQFMPNYFCFINFDLVCEQKQQTAL